MLAELLFLDPLKINLSPFLVHLHVGVNLIHPLVLAQSLLSQRLSLRIRM